MSTLPFGYGILFFNFLFVLTAILNGEPGLAGFIGPIRMMEVVVTTGSIKYAKLQSNHHHQQTNTNFYRPDALPVA